MLRLWAKQKACLGLFKLARSFGTKKIHLGCHIGTSECSGPTQYEALWASFDQTKLFFWFKFLEFGPALNPAPSIKWA